MKFPMEIIEDIEWFASRPMTVQRDDFLLGYEKLCKAKFISIPGKGTNRDMYVESTKMQAYYKEATENISTPQKWKKHVDDYKLYRDDLIDSSLAVAKADFTDKKKALELFRRFRNSFSNFTLYFGMPVVLDNYLGKIFYELLKEEFKNPEKAYQIIATPTELIEYQKMRLDIIDSVVNKKENYEELANKYNYQSEYSYIEPLLEASYFKEEVEKLSKDEAIEEKNKILGDLKKHRAQYNEVLVKIKDSKLKLFSEIIQYYSYFRSNRIDDSKKAQMNVREFFKALAKNLGEQWTDMMTPYISGDEIEAYLETKNTIDIDIIKKRITQRYVYFTNNLKSEIYMDDKEIDEICEAIRKKMDKGDNIKGLVAYKGVAKGTARMIYSSEDFSKIKEGDVLVAKTTMPYYTPIMKKAVAFVTEDGGIVSHAAITAREMKKPCIVGTGNCTKVLKDGDIVEVDADKGIVKKIV